MAAILNTVILNSALLDSAILHKTLTQTNSIWLKLIHSHSTWRCQPSWILPLGFSHFEQKNFTYSLSLNLMMAAMLNSTILDSAILHKKISLIHSDSTWWSQPSWILPCRFQPLPSWIQTPCYLLSDSLRNTLTPLWLWLKLSQSDSNSFILTQTHSFSLNLMMAAILNSAIMNLAILDSAILVFPLKLTHTCQDWFPPFAHIRTSLIYSDSTWWWQPSWNLPSWIQTLPSWIQTPCYLLWDSLRNTLTPLWLWFKLIQSD